MARAKCIILDGVKDHVVPHIVEKGKENEMWDALKKLYQHTSMQRKMLLKNQLRSYQMQRGEQIDIFLGRLAEIRDRLTSIGVMPDEEMLVRTALNTVSEDWEVFVQTLLGRESLLDWEELWATLRQEEIRWLIKVGSSDRGARIKKEEEEDVALASAGKQEKRKKKDLSKVKCFHCGELGHYVNQCPRKKSKGEASETKAAPTRAEKEVETDDDCAMSAHAPLERKWGDIELQLDGLQTMRGKILEVPNLLDYTLLREPRREVVGLADVGRDRCGWSDRGCYSARVLGQREATVRDAWSCCSSAKVSRGSTC